MVRFRIRNAEERQELQRMISAGCFWLQDTFTVADEWPEYYVFYPESKKVNGVSLGTYNSFDYCEEITFQGLQTAFQGVA